MPDDNKQDHLLEHSYDGIEEFDNPMPRWWVYLFWLPDFLHKRHGLNLKDFGPPLVVIYLIADVGSILKPSNSQCQDFVKAVPCVQSMMNRAISSARSLKRDVCGSDIRIHTQRTSCIAIARAISSVDHCMWTVASNCSESMCTISSDSACSANARCK